MGIYPGNSLELIWGRELDRQEPASYANRGFIYFEGDPLPYVYREPDKVLEDCSPAVRRRARSRDRVAGLMVGVG